MKEKEKWRDAKGEGMDMTRDIRAELTLFSGNSRSDVRSDLPTPKL